MNTKISPIFTILDAARIFGEIETAQTLETNFLSLYMGQSGTYLSSVAPYLFAYQSESEFGKWLLEKGWGNSWGMFVETNVSLEELRKHFRKFLIVNTEDGKELYFRFYDPRVLRIFLPTCDAQQLEDFFGPVKKYSMESDEPEYALEFLFEQGKLITNKIPKIDFWNRLSLKSIPVDASDIKIKNPDSKKNKPDGRSWTFMAD